ncbi:MAG: FlgD immunoglobulin-like domain containing protein, partial [bacterium]
NGIYAEYYKVVQTDVGTFAYSAYFEDKAGNPAINNNEIFGTIALRGNEFPPVSGARIVRLKTLTPENGTFTINNITLATSTMTIYSNDIKAGDKIKITNNSCVWVTSATKDGEISVSNTDIFFGFPISDYNNIATSTITEGIWVKKVMKIDDDVIINLTAVNILNTLGQPTRTTTAVIFEDARIATGTMVVVYDNNDAHIWLGTASQSGRFEASNANIYFGKLVNDYQGLGEIKGIIASFANGGVAYTDMGLIVQGISLYDNGADTHKDVIPGDGVYSNLYTIKQKDDTTSYFYGYFSSAGNNAENNGIRSQEEIVIDATPPVITNFGAFPGIFRPGSENVTIKYTLLEIGSKVTIEIWQDNDRIRKLTIPEPQYGDNCSATWDGKNLGGGLVKDGDYTFKINAVDTAGNKATERIGIIKASTINITITELKINPSIFTPTPQTEDDTDFWTDIHVTLEATKAQLQNLGFEMDSEDIYTLPYLLVDFTCFDALGNELRPLGLPDLNTGDSDEDPFTNGYPNYYTGPFGTETGHGWYPKLGTDLPDEGDGNKGNDWNTLVPLQRDPLDENQYYIDWGVGIKDWNIPNGTYIIRMQVELVGSCWKFIDYVRDAAENPIAEKWHQKPNHAKGYSRTSESVEGRVEVIDSPIIKPDYIAPVIIMTDPGANTIHEPTENISVISAQLMDQGGAGIDFGLSTIILKNSVGLVMAGEPSNNGIDTVKWTLKDSLTIPDDYTIEVKAVDKAKNGSEDTPQIFTFTILDRMGPKISDILVDSTVLKDKDIFGPNVIQKITVTLSEIETGKSKVDFASSKIIVKKQSTGEEDEPHKLFGGSRRDEKINETENSGRIIYENLTINEGGTYTIWVEAWDKNTNSNYSQKLTFYVSVEGYIYVYFNYPSLGTKTYLVIPPDTTAETYATSGVTVSTNTISIKQGTITPNEGYTPIDPAIEFWWFNTEHTDITLAHPTGNISLTMYYGHKLPLPIGITEDNLAIWRYNGTIWQNISGVNDIDRNNNKITVNLSVDTDVILEDSYAIMY